MVVLSGGHQLAQTLPPGIAAVLAIFARVAAQGGSHGDLQQEIQGALAAYPEDPKPLWEPIEIYGWKIHATLYRQDEKLWWLVHAERKNEKTPDPKDIAFLDKILHELGAEPKRHLIIGPTSSPRGEPALPFGWWTWQNRWPLYEIQINKHARRDKEKIRIVPLGTRATEGYQTVDVSNVSPKESEP